MGRTPRQPNFKMSNNFNIGFKIVDYQPLSYGFRKIRTLRYPYRGSRTLMQDCWLRAENKTIDSARYGEIDSAFHLLRSLKEARYYARRYLGHFRNRAIVQVHYRGDYLPYPGKNIVFARELFIPSASRLISITL